MPGTHRLTPGKDIRIKDVPTKADGFHSDRKSAGEEFRDLRDELIRLQPRLYAENRQKLLIVLQAMDAGGKDGTIRRVFKGVNPQGVRVTSFKVPSKEELAHDFLWRIHKAVPARGMIGVFNRSHYEDVLVVRVLNLVSEDQWRPRYGHINQFERMLHETGTRILKFYLHISPEEQLQRFRSRYETPHKQWKFSVADLEKRRHWNDYMEAFQDVLNECTTPWAPWYVIPSDQKWYRNLAITRVVVDTLREMDPQFPPPEELGDVKFE